MKTTKKGLLTLTAYGIFEIVRSMVPNDVIAGTSDLEVKADLPTTEISMCQEGSDISRSIADYLDMGPSLNGVEDTYTSKILIAGHSRKDLTTGEVVDLPSETVKTSGFAFAENGLQYSVSTSYERGSQVVDVSVRPVDTYDRHLSIMISDVKKDGYFDSGYVSGEAMDYSGFQDVFGDSLSLMKAANSDGTDFSWGIPGLEKSPDYNCVSQSLGKAIFDKVKTYLDKHN